MRSGRLRERVEIQAEARTANGQGGYTTAWATIANGRVAAEVTGQSGGEAMKAGVERGVQQWRVLIRRRDQVTNQHRLLWAGKVLDIKAAMPDPKDPMRATLLLCESGAIA